jgi:hypothetical protein
MAETPLPFHPPRKWTRERYWSAKIGDISALRYQVICSIRACNYNPSFHRQKGKRWQSFNRKTAHVEASVATSNPFKMYTCTVHCTVTVPVYTVLAERNGRILRKRLS